MANSRKNLNKTIINVLLLSKNSENIQDIYEKINNEEKILENQFINDYPDLSLSEREDLAESIVQIKYFDEIEKIENDYINKVDLISYKIDEFYDNELQIARVKFNYDYIRENNFIEKIRSIILTDNIDDLNNLNCKEQLQILNDMKKENHGDKKYEVYDN